MQVFLKKTVLCGMNIYKLFGQPFECLEENIKIDINVILYSIFATQFDC